MNRRAGMAAAFALVATTIVANYLTSTLGFVPVGFGLVATAGTFAAGCALALRDVTQDALGRRGVLVVIVVAAALSFVIASPSLALASGVAFLLSELADFAVYTPLRARARLGGRRWATAVVASNAAGAVVDSVVFLGVAFGAASILGDTPGQLVGKSWATLAYLTLGWAVTRAVLRQPVHPDGA